ncbi:glycoside hydrolase family 43 protein [Gracilimonas mengyeensis]|uniref:Beta-xylosidase n=1 Tax=Gracilimonas mengyeensis TaxID=1302730 RepID=A0A521AYA9_9BACT|nr:glycoside hydrolase 43 family protein [Gracilimonas mengyeensis]SMO39823.1 Beta-xylosidase [Gracilimonas mengyeensis]
MLHKSFWDLFLNKIREISGAHFLLLFLIIPAQIFAQTNTNGATNPLIWADVPDMSMIRVGENYYMSSTTMHMNPGVPIMKSTDLANWEIISYAYNKLEDIDATLLKNGKEMYGSGTWASSLRYHEGTFYLSTFSSTTGKTYIFTTTDIEDGNWTQHSFERSLHDHTLVFEDDKIYMIWGSGTLRIIELKKDLSGIKPETEQVFIENATAPSGDDIMLPAEGSQLFKVNGKYYLFNISWPRDDMRTVIVHRSDSLMGPYEGRVVLKDRGIAQGGLIDTPEGDWYAYLFRDYGSVGRIPYLTPVSWEDGWPVLGIDGVVPDTLKNLPKNTGLKPGIVASDDFEREKGEADLPLVWQWNHNPLEKYWSLTDRPGYLRLINDRSDDTFLTTRNTLTQRTIGPTSTGEVALDISSLKDGDVTGLGALQANYGYIAVKKEDGETSIIMAKGTPEEGEHIVESAPLDQNVVHLKADLDFEDLRDIGTFSYSLDGDEWKQLGNELEMSYTLPHFMGYRFALFNYATESAGGYADFDYFEIY